jgi:hypothetical protein
MTNGLVTSNLQSWRQHSFGQRNKSQFGYASVPIALDEPVKKTLSFEGRMKKLYKKRVALVSAISVALIAISFILALGTARLAVGAEISSEIVVRLSPSTVINNSMIQGDTFSVNITAYGVESLHGFVVGLTYDANLLECTYVEEGKLLLGFGNTTASLSIERATGIVHASVNLTSPESVANGNGTLAFLTFDVKGIGETNIALQNLDFYDSTGSKLAYLTIDGYFNNKIVLDFSMPLVLFAVTFISVFLNGTVEGKLKTVMEDREFRVQDAVLLVGLMSVMIYLVVFVRQIALVLMALFLFAYCLLLFTFTYVFSKNRWYVSILPPAVFILLYIFVRDTPLWMLYLVNIYGLIFAVLITLYLASLFVWKTTAVFGVLITIMDIILVLVTGTMVEAAEAARGLSLPVMVSLPLIPLIVTGNGLLMLSLGLGDFFFAGLLGVQTFKRYGRRFAILTMLGMAASFFVFEVFLLNYIHGAFPGTLMIICGWAPLVILKEFLGRRSRPLATAISDSSQENKDKN